MMKANKIVYYISTGLLTLLILFSAGMYFFNYEEVAVQFANFGFPTYVIYPLAVAKTLGIIAIWFVTNKTVKEWAYAGLFFNFILAFFAHFMISDGEQWAALVAFILLNVSYIYGKQLRK